MNISEVVPFFAVKDMSASHTFYLEGLGFELKYKWEDGGIIRWCRIQYGSAGIMLQQYRTEGHDSRQFSDNKGEGVSLCFNCDDVIPFYHKIKAHGLNPTEPQVGNSNWVTSVTDPDGYKLAFQSDTDVAEEVRLSEVE